MRLLIHAQVRVRTQPDFVFCVFVPGACADVELEAITSADVGFCWAVDEDDDEADDDTPYEW